MMLAFRLAMGGLFLLVGSLPSGWVEAVPQADAAPVGSPDVGTTQIPPPPAVEAKGERFEPFAPNGAVVLVGGGDFPADARKRFMELAGNGKARLVVIPTASESAGTEEAEYWLEPWREFNPESLELLHTRDRAVADSEEFASRIEQASGVWISGGDQSRLAEAYLGTRTQTALEAVSGRGGVVGGTSAGAAIASRVMIAEGRETPKMAEGFNLLPGAIVDQHFTQRGRSTRLVKAVAANPACVGIGIDEDTAVVFRRRSMQVIGPGRVHLRFSATPHFPAAELEIAPGTAADWTTALRTNRERAQPDFLVGRSTDQVEFPGKGSLVIVGGGQMDKAIVDRFVELAGGGAARIVILPTAMENPARRSGEFGLFRSAGAASVTVLRETSAEAIQSDAFLDSLREASGVWFGGGRQWRFVDHYEGTAALEEIRQVLTRGGVIGGSSAGASIQGELLIRGAPTGNSIMVQDGYRRGFGFFRGVGIDQHFSQRGRGPDLERAISQFPGMVGIGIDEGTALVVTDGMAEVLGAGKVFVVGRGPAGDGADPLPVQTVGYAAGEKIGIAGFHGHPKNGSSSPDR